MRLPGSKFAPLLATCAVLGCVLLLRAADRNEAPHAVVAGTVFRENGFSLPGAAVTLAVKEAPGVSTKKMKKLQSVSDPRGEFAFRVPPGRERMS